MEQNNTLKKQSVLRQIMFIFAITILFVLIVTATGSYYYSKGLIQRRSLRLAITAARLTQDLIENVTIEALSKSSNSEIYKESRKSIRNLCRYLRLEYLYVFAYDKDHKYLEYIIAVASDDEKDKIVEQNLPLGAVIKTNFNEPIKKVLKGEIPKESFNINNQYGNVYTWLYPVTDKDKKVRYVIGVEYTVEQFMAFVKNNALFVIIPIVLVSLILLFIEMSILERKVFNPIKKISERMYNFVENKGIDSKPLKITSNDEIREISDSFYKMTDEIIAYVKDIRQLTKEKTEADVQIEVAKGIQYGIVPHNLALNTDKYDACACAYSAKYIGGDFYDCFTLENGNVCIVIGDVSGKGVSAALFMAMAKTAIRELLKAGKSPAQTLNFVNDELCESNPEGMFVTVFAAILDVNTGVLTYANAGHTRPVLFGDTIEFLNPDCGTALGLFEDAGIIEETLQLNNNHGILLYTDGVTEAVNPNNEFFGEQRLLDALNSRKEDKTVSENIINIVRSNVYDFYAGREQFDDLTALVLVYK